MWQWIFIQFFFSWFLCGCNASVVQTKNENWFKGCCMLNWKLVVEMGTAVQIQMAITWVARLRTIGMSAVDNERRWALNCRVVDLLFPWPWNLLNGCRDFLCLVGSEISWVSLFAGFQLATLGVKYYWLNWQWAESHRPKQKQTFWHGTHISN